MRGWVWAHAEPGRVSGPQRRPLLQRLLRSSLSAQGRWLWSQSEHEHRIGTDTCSLHHICSIINTWRRIQHQLCGRRTVSASSSAEHRWECRYSCSIVWNLPCRFCACPSCTCTCTCACSQRNLICHRQHFRTPTVVVMETVQRSKRGGSDYSCKRNRCSDVSSLACNRFPEANNAAKRFQNRNTA